MASLCCLTPFGSEPSRKRARGRPSKEHGRLLRGAGSFADDLHLPNVSFAAAKSVAWLHPGRSAEVSVNGKNLGILWKPPFRVDITDAVYPGPNQVEVKVTNLWPNRIIGDEQLPPEVKWNGNHMDRWPEWLTPGKASINADRPRTGRITGAVQEPAVSVQRAPLGRGESLIGGGRHHEEPLSQVVAQRHQLFARSQHQQHVVGCRPGDELLARSH